ncbi:branched-chain-amino-acid aminotransferase [Gonapodya sp. JEL0774]|nr:branched-chain-amino-acid aminotransferase [Gonapodya sp. JEL0774]
MVQIKPFQALDISPAALVFHIGLECFEGMKAYKSSSGRTLLFRPDQNMIRLQKSVERLALPAFNDHELMECIKKLVKVDERWVPDQRGYSLYIRPTLIATEPSLALHPPSTALLFCILSPVGPYYPTGFAAVRVRATFEYTRAFPGGTGENKVGINYAPGMMPQVLAEKEGFQQCLWIWGEERVVTEVGASNFFVFWVNEHGQTELVTPSLEEGTAAVITPIRAIGYEGRDLVVPLDPADSSQGAGPLARRLFDEVVGIQYGEKEGPGGWVVEV